MGEIDRESVASTWVVRGWCQNHLNWTWITFFVLPYVSLYVDAPIIVFIILGWFWVFISLWVLHRKGRSVLDVFWLIIPISVLFLSNKKEIGQGRPTK